MRKKIISREGSAEELFRSISVIIGLDQLVENFSAKLMEMMDATHIAVVLLEPITDRYICKKARGMGLEILERLNFSKTDRLIRWLNVNRRMLETDRQTEVVRFLSEHEREVLQKTRTKLVAPLIVVNRLTGALFIGAKSSNEAYTGSEMAALSILVNQGALAIEYALMYQFQEDKLRRLFRADSLATLGELAAGAAHEIRNPLTSVRSTIQYLRKDLPEEKRLLADGIIEEVDRIDLIIQGLLSFSKSSELQLERINIHDVIDQTLLLLESEFRTHSIIVLKEFECSDPGIIGDASQLKQVFLNILLNSIQAMHDGGTILLSTETLPNPPSISIRVRDSGCGIRQEDLSRLFDPFYTTKESGTGLGLSISYGILSKHGGDIEITSRTEGPDRGTTVTIRLPRTFNPA